MKKIISTSLATLLFTFFFNTVYGSDGLVLKTGLGEAAMNGMVIKASHPDKPITSEELAEIRRIIEGPGLSTPQ